MTEKFANSSFKKGVIKMMIEKIDPAGPDHSKNIASAYKKTFGGEPWNEGWKCDACGSFFPLAFSGRHCPDCANRGKKVLLSECWPTERIVSDLRREMAKPGSVCLAAFEGKEIIGFAWGYEMEADEQIDAHLEAPGLHSLTSGTYFYLDETAVIPDRQGRGVGKKLIGRISSGRRQNRMLLRTMAGSRMFCIIKKMGGSPILDISRGRTIMTLDLLNSKTPR
ncbi:MAG: GNAT family N-acetyltransferase [Candidatus Paceibacterota bacterium]